MIGARRIREFRSWLDAAYVQAVKFWTDPVDPVNLAAFRIAFGLVYFVFVLSKTNDLIFFYSERGVLPWDFGTTNRNLSMQWSIFYPFNADWFLYLCHALNLVALFSLVIGFQTRTAAIISYFFHVMFVNRNPAIQYGADFVSALMLFYLCFANAGARFSLDEKFGWAKKDGELRNFFNSIAFRLIQIQLCIIYTYSGLSKLKGVRWWNGSAIWDVFTMEGLVRWDLSFVAYVPDVLVALCYGTLIWEIYFCVLIWLKPFRKPLIFFGVLMHLSFAVLIKIPFFSAIMASIYFVFLSPADVERMALWIRQKILRQNVV